MIKKALISIVILLLIGFGIYKIFFNGETIKDKIENISGSLNSYKLEANMELTNGEEKRNFSVVVLYSKDEGSDLFRVSLVDTSINQEQILLRNKEGVYVLTPSLNKAHKFNSSWPLNSAKPYIYQSLLEVFDGDYKIEKLEEGFIVTSDITYKNSPLYTKQEIMFSSDLKPVWVNLYNDKDEVVVRINFTNVEINNEIEKSLFEVKQSIEDSRENISDEDSVSGSVDLPYMLTGSDMNISLKDSVVANVDNEQLHMLVYSGDNDFTVIEKVSDEYDDIKIIETSADIVLTINGFAMLESNKVSYDYNGVEITIYGDSLDVATYLNIVNGMEVSANK